MLAYVKSFERMTEEERYQHAADVHGNDPDDVDQKHWIDAHEQEHTEFPQDHRHTV